MQAVILVGGQGTRLRPLTDSRPKPMMRVVDRPFVAHQLDHLVRAGVRDVVFSCGYRPDALRAQACLSGFASCLSQACGVGFSPLTELTYPLTTQTVITDGRTWTFSAFQLNTTGALLTPAEHGAPGNTCWVLPEMQLYQNVTEAGVSVCGCSGTGGCCVVWAGELSKWNCDQ